MQRPPREQRTLLDPRFGLVAAHYNGRADDSGQWSNNWYVFYQDSLVLQGIGNANDAEYHTTVFLTKNAEQKKALGHAQTEQILFGVTRKIYPETVTPAVAEYWAFRVMQAEQWDKGRISEAEFNYLAAQKQNQIVERTRALQAAEAQARAAQQQQQLARSQALLNYSAELMKASTWRPAIKPTVHCTTTPMGGVLHTDCR